jgi:hypothetical protein
VSFSPNGWGNTHLVAGGETAYMHGEMTDLPPIEPANEIPTRTVTGRFRPGFSGNPAGARKGTRHKRTLLLEATLTGKGQEILDKIIALGLAGDTNCLRICAERLLPPRKSMPIRFRLPQLTSVADAQSALAHLTAGVACGRILADEAATLASIIASFVKTVEASTLEDRIAALERGERAIAEEAPRYDA